MATQLTLRTHRKRMRSRASRGRSGATEGGRVGGYSILTIIGAIVVIIIVLKLLGLY